MSAFQVRRLSQVRQRDIEALSEVLMDCVAGGASVSFMHPMTRAKAAAFWAEVAASVARNERALIVAETPDGAVIGTAQAIWAQPENQPHRADVAKMLVHRRARRLGVGAAVLVAAENAARESGRTLLVLDTASNVAERLYERGGWQRVGTIPDYALLPDGAPCATVVYYKRLD